MARQRIMEGVPTPFHEGKLAAPEIRVIQEFDSTSIQISMQASMQVRGIAMTASWDGSDLLVG